MSNLTGHTQMRKLNNKLYILSQKHEGWTLVPNQYSDGGYTEANIERPGVR